MAGDQHQRTDVGKRVRRLRERSGKSRATLAAFVGRSEGWLKLIENGKRGLPLAMGVQLARELKAADLAEIYGPNLTAPVNAVTMPPLQHAELVGRALVTYPIGSTEPVSVPYLQAAVDVAWRDWHARAAQRSATAAVLPGLIRTGRAAVTACTGSEQRAARAALADIYHLAQACLAWIPGAMHWYWIAVERGLSTAEDADDPAVCAIGLMYFSLALRSTSQAEEALDLLRRGADMLDPLLDGRDHRPRALWGDIQLTRASTAARFGRDPSAWTHWTEADHMVTRLPAGFTSRHGFSQPHVDLHKTWIAVSLGDSGEALRHARSMEPKAVRSRVWRASHLINVARALHQQRDSTVLAPLVQAEAVSAEAVRYSVTAQEMIAALATSQRNPSRPAAAELAQRLAIDI